MGHNLVKLSIKNLTGAPMHLQGVYFEMGGQSPEPGEGFPQTINDQEQVHVVCMSDSENIFKNGTAGRADYRADRPGKTVAIAFKNNADYYGVAAGLDGENAFKNMTAKTGEFFTDVDLGWGMGARLKNS